MEESNETGLNNNQPIGVSLQMESNLIKEIRVMVNNDLEAAESKDKLEDDLAMTEAWKKRIGALLHELVEKYRNVNDLRLFPMNITILKDCIKQSINDVNKDRHQQHAFHIRQTINNFIRGSAQIFSDQNLKDFFHYLTKCNRSDTPVKRLFKMMLRNEIRQRSFDLKTTYNLQNIRIMKQKL